MFNPLNDPPPSLFHLALCSFAALAGRGFLLGPAPSGFPFVLSLARDLLLLSRSPLPLGFLGIQLLVSQFLFIDVLNLMRRGT